MDKKKKQSVKQKNYCNKFNKDFKNGPHQKKKTLRKKEVPQKGHRILVPPSAASITLKIEPLGKGALSSDHSSPPPHEGRGPGSLPYSPQVAWVYEEGPLLLGAAVNLGLPAVTRAFSLGTPQNLRY